MFPHAANHGAHRWPRNAPRRAERGRTDSAGARTRALPPTGAGGRSDYPAVRRTLRCSGAPFKTKNANKVCKRYRFGTRRNRSPLILRRLLVRRLRGVPAKTRVIGGRPPDPSSNGHRLSSGGCRRSSPSAVQDRQRDRLHLHESRMHFRHPNLYFRVCQLPS
jgi:hypothetical protein